MLAGRPRLVHSPRSRIDDLKLETQGVLIPLSARRRDLLASTSLKRKKELFQWIETDNPNGIEILDRLSRSPTPFAAVIRRAVIDFRVVERRAAALFERDFTEFSQRQDETAASLAESEATLARLLIDNKRIRDQIARGEADQQSLRDGLTRLQTQLACREEPECLNVERAKLEATLESLESRLIELTKQQKELLQRPVRM
jgi:hypothetical protein